MNRIWRALLIVIAVACFAVALSYPIRYHLAQESNNSELESLSAMRQRVRESEATAPGEGDGQRTTRQATGEPAGEGESPTAPVSDNRDDEAAAPAPEGEGAQLAAPTRTDGEAAARGEESAAAAAQPSGAALQGQGGDGSARPNGQTDTDNTHAGATEAGAAANDTQADAQSGAQAGNQSNATDADGEEIVPLMPTRATRPPDGEWPDAGGAHQSAGASDGDNQAAGATGGEPTAISEPTAIPEPTAVPEPTPTPGLMDLILDPPWLPGANATPEPRATAAPAGPTAVPSPTPDRTIRLGALPYPDKEKIELDETKILPELREIHEINHDLIGWLVIDGTVIDYPVVQAKDSEFYLSHDFYGNDNINGQIILDPLCDPYTPSYNLIISGHHMKNGSMFGNLPEYRLQKYWEQHKLVEFDSLMFRKRYVVFAAFYSADYDEDEEGFRYNADVRYRKEVDMWLEEIRENQLYDTGIDVEFGDEFITLTTCNRARHRNGRFVVVCRKIREGEMFE